MNKFLLQMVSVAAALFIVSCGGGGGGGDSLAGGGTSGTGTGTVSGFGSVIINDIREFQVGGSTSVTIDGEPAAQSDLKIGMVVNFTVGDDANSDLTAGTANLIAAVHQVKGPVTSLSPLAVFGQPVIATGDTLLDGFSSLSDLAVGDLLEVSGFSDGLGGVQATLLERKTSVAKWKLIGTVSNLVSGTQFKLGAQMISLSGVEIKDCAGGLQNGALVEVKATADSDVASGGVLNTATSIECKSTGLAIPDDAGASIKAGVEGLIDSFSTSSKQLVVNGQTVSYSSATVFEGGVETDLALGVKVEAEGSLDTASKVLSAAKIRFRQNQVRIEAPVDETAVSAGDLTEVIGIAVSITAQTRIDSISGPGQVEVKGFADKNGQVYATEWRDKGNQDPSDIRLEGPASNPVSNTQFEVLGAVIDVSSADSVNPSVSALFNAINAGTAEVKIQHGELSAPNIILHADIELE